MFVPLLRFSMIPCSSFTLTFGTKSAFDKHILCSGPPIDLTLVNMESTFNNPFQEFATLDEGREWSQKTGKECKINIKLIENVEDKPSISSTENEFVIKQEEALSPSPAFGEEERERHMASSVFTLVLIPPRFLVNMRVQDIPCLSM